MQARRNEEVARAFGRRRGQNRRLKFGEALFDHPSADRGDHVRPQQDVALHLLPPQIEEAIAQTRFFPRLFVRGDDQRRDVGRAQKFERIDANFDRAGRQFRIHRRLIAGDHAAIDANHAFNADLFNLSQERAVGVAHALRETVAIAQIDEQQPAMIALTMNPARNPDGLTGVVGAQRAAIMRSVGVHRVS